MTTFGSVCSGIEAASVAWHPLGWRAAWLAEIEPFPSAVLAHHYPDVPTLRAMNHADSHANGGGQMAVAFNWNAQASQLPTADRDTSINDGLTCSQQGAVAVDCYNGAIDGDTTLTLRKGNGNELGGVPAVMRVMQVRRLTPRECERLQGFPDDYTLIPWRNKPASECPDGPRYKALGNSWAVPNVRWIGRRIDQHLRQLDAANDNQPAALAAIAS